MIKVNGILMTAHEFNELLQKFINCKLHGVYNLSIEEFKK